jgi:hypothetical protein
VYLGHVDAFRFGVRSEMGVAEATRPRAAKRSRRS